MKTKFFGRTFVAAALCAAAFTANAGPVSVQWLNFAAGSQNVTVGETNAGGNISAAAGAFNVNIDGESFLTYCVELTQYASTSALQYTRMAGSSFFDMNYTPVLGVNGAVVVERIGRLFTYLGGMQVPKAVGTQYSASEVSAAIQLAVWESVYEGDNPLSVSGAQNDLTNKFMAVSAPADVISYANLILAGAATAANQYSVSIVWYGTQPGQGAQDYLLLERNPSRSELPEPASLGLVALGLVAAGLASRRRRA